MKTTTTMVPLKLKLICFFAFFVSSLQLQADIIALQDTNKADGTVAPLPLEEVRQLLQAGKVEKARILLSKAVDRSPNQPHNDIILARLLGEIGRGPEARQMLELLALAEPNRLDVRVVFCELAVRESRWFDAWTHALAADKAQEPESWTEEHQKIVQRGLQMLKAACCEGRGDWKGATDIYSLLLTKKEQPVDVLTALGRCEFHQEHVANALQHFENAFKADPQLDVPELAIATLFDLAGKLDQAEKHFQIAITHKDDSGRSRAQLAFARWLLWNNRAEQIPRVLTAKFEVPEMEKDRQLLLGMAARMQQQHTQARQLFSELHQKDPNVFPVSNQLALVLIEADDEGLRSRALQIAEANVRNNPGLAEAWSTLGWIQFRLGDLASAKQNLSKATSGGVISRDTAWQLAQVHKRLGNTKEADGLLAAANSSKGPFFAFAAVKPR